jgi:hypothetical protein
VLLRNPGAGNLPAPLRIADDLENEEIVHPTLAMRAKVTKKKLKLLLRELAANWESLCEENDPKVAQRNAYVFWEPGRTPDGFSATRCSKNSFSARHALHNHPDLTERIQPPDRRRVSDLNA